MTTLAAARRTMPSIHFSRPQRHDRPADADPVGEAGRGRCARTATSALPTPSIRHSGRGGGGLAWGSCGRSGRHALGRAAGASCVQRLDDSRNSAIHTTYRISLRSSSLQEPRYPLLRVVATCLHPPGGRRISPTSVVLSATRTPPPGGGRAESLSSGPVPRGTEEGGRPRDGCGGRRPSPRIPPRGQRAAPTRHLAHYLPAQARGARAGDHASGRGPSRYVHGSRCSSDVCQ